MNPPLYQDYGLPSYVPWYSKHSGKVHGPDPSLLWYYSDPFKEGNFPVPDSSTRFVPLPDSSSAALLLLHAAFSCSNSFLPLFLFLLSHHIHFDQCSKSSTTLFFPSPRSFFLLAES